MSFGCPTGPTHETGKIRPGAAVEGPGHPNKECRMRKLITGMKVSLDGKMESAEGMADWVHAWSEDYDLTPEIDACLLGAVMYGGYERYWTGIQNEPDRPAWITGTPPTPAEIEWAGFIKRTPHYVLSNTINSALWPTTKFVRTLDEIAALKREAGKDIYLMGGARSWQTAPCRGRRSADGRSA